MMLQTLLTLLTKRHSPVTQDNMLRSDQLVMVPALMHACMLACGVKAMRLVSKGIRHSMLALVTDCTIELTGACDDWIQMMALFQHARLNSLKLVIQLPEGQSRLGLQGLDAHRVQLVTFLHSMQPAIQACTFLSLDVKEASLAPVVQQLGQSLPRLQHLQVCGHIPRDLFASFAAACSSLRTIEVNGNLLSCNTSTMRGVLPNMTHLILKAESADDLEKWARLSHASTTFTSITIVDAAMTASIWENVAPCVQSIECGETVDMDLTSLRMPVLTSLTLHSYDGNFNLHPLTQFLTLAPLTQLALISPPRAGIPHVRVESDPAAYADLALLHGHLTAGLHMPSNLNLIFNAEGTEQETQSFFTGLPVMPATAGVMLQAMQIPEVLPAKFPNITSFGLLGDKEATIDELRHLLRCTLLQEISLDYAADPSTDPTAMVMLCTALPQLKVLRLQREQLL